MHNMYTRPKRARVAMSADAVPAWKRTMSERTRGQFQKTRHGVWERRAAYAPALAKALAVAYKLGDPFPSHFDFVDGAYALHEPRALAEARPAQKKKSAFLEGVLAAMVADGQMDRFAALALGLATAGKVPHWSLYDVTPSSSHDYFSETDDDD